MASPWPTLSSALKQQLLPVCSISPRKGPGLYGHKRPPEAHTSPCSAHCLGIFPGAPVFNLCLLSPRINCEGLLPTCPLVQFPTITEQRLPGVYLPKCSVDAWEGGCLALRLLAGRAWPLFERLAGGVLETPGGTWVACGVVGGQFPVSPADHGGSGMVSLGSPYPVQESDHCSLVSSRLLEILPRGV